MKRITALVLMVVMMTHAGVIDSSKVVLPHNGSQALEFGLSGLFNIGSYVGNAIALKKFSSPSRATRYVLNINGSGYNLSGKEHEVDYNPHPADSTIDSTNYDYTTKRNSQDIFVSVQWIKYHQPYGNLSLLFGVGPLIGFDQSTRENVKDPRTRIGENDWYDSKSGSTAFYLGVNPVVGIEWFLHKNVSLHSEYYTLVTAGWRVETEDYDREYSSGDWYQKDSKLSGVYYNVRGYARAGVSFYFK